jgi:hypothetical protein
MSTKYVSARRTFGPPSNLRQAPYFSTAVNTVCEKLHSRLSKLHRQSPILHNRLNLIAEIYSAARRKTDAIKTYDELIAIGKEAGVESKTITRAIEERKKLLKEDDA